MLVSAPWVVPISRPPIREGALLIKGGVVAEIGIAADMESRNHGGQRIHFPGCAIMPGLVNAHTHLALTCLKDAIPPAPFHQWLSRIPVAFRALSNDDLAASISLGAIKAVVSGTTTVGDIAYGPESIAIAADTGLSGTFFWEVLGLRRDELPAELYRLEFPTDPLGGCSGRLRCGISPHAPYTSGPELLRATHLIASAQHAPYAIHVAESPSETELLSNGTGPLSELAERLAYGFESPGRSAVAYLDSLGVLQNAIAIHCTNILPSDITPLAKRAAGVVLCPRSNRYLDAGVAPSWRLDRAGVVMAIGTDSLASNTDLDLFEEVRALRDLEPRFSAERLIEMMTIGGARVLGMNDVVGSLAEGMQADLAIYRVPETSDPFSALLDHAGRSSVEAVLSAGVWRMREGAPTFAVSVIERASRLASNKAALALELARQTG